MTTEPPRRRSAPRRLDPRPLRRLVVAVLASALVVGVASCTSTPTGDSDATVSADPVIYPLSLQYRGIRTVSDVPYGQAPLQQLDVCLPAGASVATSASTPPETSGGAAAVPSGAATPRARGTRAAIMMIHGGSWTHGDKATAAYHAVCQYFASEGFVVFNVDYRLAPTDPFPAGLDDVRRALDWVFRTSTLDRYDVDAQRVGVFGGSAGGNLASLLGLEDHESAAYADGDRIRAVAELSGPSDLTTASTEAGGVTPRFQRTQLRYLDCTAYADCPAAERASPVHQVTKDTPPFFIGQSTHEFIPQWESRRFAAELRRHDVPVTLVMVRGTAHSIAQLDEGMSRRVVAFFRARLR
ncbi:alpha/beta hydrolase [Curtobacterium sp. RRHDQ10]|uniref:alpha/beta hydrolase n=1 Tax=Curtobacterium phyllosphaerae TaxID=3413379 RepID=UPI003BF025FA